MSYTFNDKIQDTITFAEPEDELTILLGTRELKILFKEYPMKTPEEKIQGVKNVITDLVDTFFNDFS